MSRVEIFYDKKSWLEEIKIITVLVSYSPPHPPSNQGDMGVPLPLRSTSRWLLE